MEFVMKFSMNNAAFAGGQAPGEVARILRKAAEEAEGLSITGNVRDSNGNMIGGWDMMEPSKKRRGKK
jgi:hypothetical protein